jgi:sulfite reductase alpha subunit-like flavoprotein
MGDSHYWPRPDEKIYFAKSGKDLDERLEVMGAQRLTPCGIGDDQVWPMARPQKPVLTQKLPIACADCLGGGV